jgi:hypothetical protein
MKFLKLLLLSSKLNEQVSFYRDVLGFPLCEITPSSATFQVGTSLLTFKKTEDEVYYHFAFRIPFVMFDSAKRWTKQRISLLSLQSGVDEFVSENWHSRSIYFEDSESNCVEFIAHPSDVDIDNINHDFDISLVKGVGEIGLVVPEIVLALDNLSRITRESSFRDEVDYNFSSHGNQQGRIIVVKQERVWYPEHRPARYCHFELEFESDAKVLGAILSDHFKG